MCDSLVGGQEEVRLVLQPEVLHCCHHSGHPIVDRQQRTPAVPEDIVGLGGLCVGDWKLVGDEPVEIRAGGVVVRRAWGLQVVDPCRGRPEPSAYQGAGVKGACEARFPIVTIHGLPSFATFRTHSMLLLPTMLAL